MADPKLGNFELILTNRQDRRTDSTAQTDEQKIRGMCTIAPFGGNNVGREVVRDAAVLAPAQRNSGCGLDTLITSFGFSRV